MYPLSLDSHSSVRSQCVTAVGGIGVCFVGFIIFSRKPFWYIGIRCAREGAWLVGELGWWVGSGWSLSRCFEACVGGGVACWGVGGQPLGCEEASRGNEVIIELSKPCDAHCELRRIRMCAFISYCFQGEVFVSHRFKFSTFIEEVRQCFWRCLTNWAEGSANSIIVKEVLG